MYINIPKKISPWRRKRQVSKRGSARRSRTRRRIISHSSGRGGEKYYILHEFTNAVHLNERTQECWFSCQRCSALSVVEGVCCRATMRLFIVERDTSFHWLILRFWSELYHRLFLKFILSAHWTLINIYHPSPSLFMQRQAFVAPDDFYLGRHVFTELYLQQG